MLYVSVCVFSIHPLFLLISKHFFTFAYINDLLFPFALPFSRPLDSSTLLPDRSTIWKITFFQSSLTPFSTP